MEEALTLDQHHQGDEGDDGNGQSGDDDDDDDDDGGDQSAAAADATATAQPPMRRSSSGANLLLASVAKGTAAASSEVGAALGLALSCLAPVPSVLLRRLTHDTQRLQLNTESRVRDMTRLAWATLTGRDGSEEGGAGGTLRAAAAQGGEQEQCLITELLVQQMKAVLSQDIDKARACARFCLAAAGLRMSCS